MRRLLALAGLLALSGAQAAGTTHEVRIENMRFVPEALEVSAGDTVRWVNRDVVPHTVTAKAQGIESGSIDAGKQWTFVVPKAGRIDYLCRFHPMMRASLAVRR